MGLFGYNEKDYNKNTGILSNQMTALADRVPWGDVRQLLNKVILEIEKYPCPKGNGKAQKALDERIAALIQTMTDDLQQGSQSRCIEHGTLLMSAIVDARQFGKERYSEQELQVMEKMARASGSLRDAYDQATAIEKQMADVRRQAMKYDPNSAEYKKLGVQYNGLKDKMSNVLQTADRFAKQLENLRLQNNIQMTNATTAAIEDLGIMSGADIAKEVEKMQRGLEKEQIRNEQYDDAREAYNAAVGGVAGGNVTDALGADLETERAKKAYDSIQGSRPDPFGFGSGTSDSDDVFTDPFGDAR